MTNIPGTFDMTSPRGWICPKCNAVMSPSSPCCWYCKPNTSQTITSANVGETLALCKHGSPIKFGCVECGRDGMNL